LPSLTHPHVVPNLYEFHTVFILLNTKDILKNVGNKTADTSH